MTLKETSNWSPRLHDFMHKYFYSKIFKIKIDHQIQKRSWIQMYKVLSIYI